MTTFLPQPYPFWVGYCQTDGKPMAFRVVGWITGVSGDSLDPMVVLQGGDHTSGAHRLMSDLRWDAENSGRYAYGDSPAKARDAAATAVQRSSGGAV